MAKARKRLRRVSSQAIATIKATFNNTVISITDLDGDVLCWASAGTIGFKGSRKSTPFAAQRTAESAAEKAQKLGVRQIEVRVKGPGSGRESAIRALQAAGLEIKAIEDVTPLPHNGCRPKKRRRV
ncbi:MAG: 30S ribosomal protein S11 [Planctomycetota bacterium]